MDAVIWATGYRPDYCWIELPIFDPDGRLRHRRGVTDVPGLYFLGLPWQHTRGSALIGWVGDDAEFIAGEIEAAGRPRHGRGSTKEQRPDAATPATRLPARPKPPRELYAASARLSCSLKATTVELRIAPVAKRSASDVRMLAYNGSIPARSCACARAQSCRERPNEGDLEATVHWHGLRLDNRFDGTHETQAPIPVGGTSPTHRVPRPRRYWYHPHIREDYGQEMGLYGNILVDPGRGSTGRPAPRARPDHRRRPDRGRRHRTLQPVRRRRTRPWADSAT